MGIEKYFGMASYYGLENIPLFEAFGEKKTLKEWYKDHRCSDFIQTFSRNYLIYSIQRLLSLRGGEIRSEDFEKVLKREFYWSTNGHLHILYKGKELNLNEYADKVGVNRNTIMSRLKKGLSLEEAIAKKVPKEKPKPLKKYSYNDKMRNLSEIVYLINMKRTEDDKIKRTTIISRMNSGMTLEEAINQNVLRKCRKKKD